LLFIVIRLLISVIITSHGGTITQYNACKVTKMRANNKIKSFIFDLPSARNLSKGNKFIGNNETFAV
jgi:hypothetical protein